jgi:hypothetical protein
MLQIPSSFKKNNQAKKNSKKLPQLPTIWGGASNLYLYILNIDKFMYYHHLSNIMKLRGRKTYWLGVASNHFAKRQKGNDECLYDIHNNPNFLQLSYPFQLFTIIVIEFETRTFLRPQSPRMEWAIQVSHHPWDIVAIESFLNLIML